MPFGKSILKSLLTAFFIGSFAFNSLALVGSSVDGNDVIDFLLFIPLVLGCLAGIVFAILSLTLQKNAFRIFAYLGLGSSAVIGLLLSVGGTDASEDYQSDTVTDLRSLFFHLLPLLFFVAFTSVDTFLRRKHNR